MKLEIDFWQNRYNNFLIKFEKLSVWGFRYVQYSNLLKWPSLLKLGILTFEGVALSQLIVYFRDYLDVLE